jgi:large subunit ribosomal protein L31
MIGRTYYGTQRAMAEGEKRMKPKIHPKYHVIKVRCTTCGNEFEVGTTSENLRVDTCSNCHPFYTGTQTFIQAAGRVEKFNKRYGLNEKKQDNE